LYVSFAGPHHFYFAFAGWRTDLAVCTGITTGVKDESVQLREQLKRALPGTVMRTLQSVRNRLAAPPLEEIVLHDYKMVPEPGDRPRLTLVIPSIAPEKTFGGVLTGIDIVLALAKRSDAQLRILLDDRGPVPLGTCVPDRAQKLALDMRQVEIVPRLQQKPSVQVRSSDVFMTYNWWTSLNIRRLIDDQAQHFGQAAKPSIYLIQEYEPAFYAMSSTHMAARQAFEPSQPCWGIFNSTELFQYSAAQGHKLGRSYIFEPQLDASLRRFLERAPTPKKKRILVYGRPTVPRNCYPAIEKGLRAWARRYPEFADWEIVSAGDAHQQIELAPGQRMKSVGKLTLEQYGELLLTTAVGLSLMSSPHPSYPPLEMAHFGLWTVTNRYANKDLSLSHSNIISTHDIAPDSIATALAQACRNYENDPNSGWMGQSWRPSFLEKAPFRFLEELSVALRQEVWR
jgi:hypothetical protein